MVGGAVVDIGARELVVEPTTDPVLEATVTDLAVYLRIGTKDSAQELRSYAVDDGKLRWSVTLLERGKAPGMPPELFCRGLAAGPAGVFCVTNRGVRLFAAANGAASEVISSDRVRIIERLGDRIVVLVSGASSCTQRCIESDLVEVIDATTGEALAKPRDRAAVTPMHLSFRTLAFSTPAGFQTFTPHGRELCVLSTAAWPVSGGVTRDNLDVNCFSSVLEPRIEVHERFEGAELELLHGDERWVVVSNKGKGPPSYLVDLEKPGVEESSVPITAVIANEDGAVDALIVSSKLLETSGARRFDLPRDLKGSVRGVRTKDTIVLSARDVASETAVIIAVDAKTGAERWRGEVALRASAATRETGSHALELDGDALLLRGTEWGQTYLAAFALADGKKLLEVVRAR